jgi:glycosyltransferase involved in cell wall biosynthesis
MGSAADRTQRLRVLECLTYYLPHRTGLTLHVQRLAEGLARRGHDVTVLSARFRPELSCDEPIAGVRVVRLRAPWRVSRGMVMPAYSSALRRLMEANDVVHVHSPMLEAALVARACRRWRRPLVVTHHGDLILPRGAFNRVVERAVLAMFRPAAMQAHRIVAYSRDYAVHSRWLRPWLDRVVSIPPPIDVPAPDPARVEALRTRTDLAGRRVIGYAGRFVEEKRPDLVLAALPAVRATLPAAALLFAGQHRLPYERFFERCRALVDEQREHVRFVGLLEDPAELAAFYGLCDVLVLPSQSECFGLVQPEAMLCGTPVVASDIPGARVPVLETGMGLLVPPGRPEALAAAIVSVLRDRARFVRPRSEVERTFSLDSSLDAYEHLLRHAAGRCA